MLSRENSILFFIIFLLISSCETNNDADIYLVKSIEIIGNNEYFKIRQQIYDSIENWNKNQLLYFSDSGLYKLNWKIDTLLCFNNNKTKFVTSIEKQFNDRGQSEGIDFLYGAKIENKWYFFTGAYIVLPREMYQKDITKPLSFEKLHEIALKEVFSGYLKKRNPIPILNILFPMYEVNEVWFDQKFKGVGWGCGTWIDKDGDGNSEWVDTCSEEEFNKMYYTKYHSVWELPADKSLFDTNIKRWTWITTDSFNRLFQAKKIDSFGYPYGTKYDREKNEITFPNGTRF